MPNPVDARWQHVTCANCGKQYQCTPQQDYYCNENHPGTTLSNGICWDCLLEENGISGRPEPSYVALEARNDLLACEACGHKLFRPTADGAVCSNCKTVYTPSRA